MKNLMVGAALRNLADRVEMGSVAAFSYEWVGGDTLNCSETIIPSIPPKFIQITVNIDEVVHEPQLDTDQRQGNQERDAGSPQAVSELPDGGEVHQERGEGGEEGVD